MAKDNGAPEGFDIAVGRSLGEGWIRKSPGVVVLGRLIGRFTGSQVDDDGVKQSFYQVEAYHDIPATKKDKETGKSENIVVHKGEIINIGEHKALEDLAARCADGGVYDVWFEYVKEDNIPRSTRTFWVINGPKLKMIKPPKVQTGTPF